MTTTTGTTMTTRRRRTTTPAADIELANLPPVPDGFAPLSPTEERRERELEDILSELGSDARVKVWQIIDGKASYAGDMSADGFTLDALLEAFGGGDKSLVIMQGKTRVEKVTVSLDPSIPPKNPRTPKPVPGQPAPGGLDMNNMFALMAKSQMDSAQMMTNVMGGIVAALTTVMGATRNADPVAQAIQIATVLKPANNGNVSEAMTMFREGMELAERYAGKDDDDGVMGVVSKGLDTLTVLINGMVEERKAKLARGLPAGGGDSAGQAGGGGDGSGDGGDGGARGDGTSAPSVADGMSVRPWVDAVRPNIGKLLSASSFLPPSSAADAIAKTLSDDQFFDLIDDIQDQTNGGFGERLKEYFPKDIATVDPHWLGEVLQILLSEHVDEPGAEDEPATGDGATRPENN